MRNKNIIIFSCLLLHVFALHSMAEPPQVPSSSNKEEVVEKQVNETAKMLNSLLELQLNLKEQIQLSQNKLATSKSDLIFFAMYRV